MKLEEAIKQKSFSSEYQKLILNLMYTVEWLHDPIKKVIQKEKLTGPQYNILRILKGSAPQPLSPQDVKSVMINKKSDLTRMIDRLVSKDLIDRHICPTNRRKMDLFITEKGIQLLDKLHPIIKEASEERISRNITVEEANYVNEIIDKLRG